MAIEYGFTQQERNQYFNPEKVYSSWGRDFLNDFMVLYVYDLEGKATKSTLPFLQKY